MAVGKVRYPNIDQIKKSARDITYIKETEFETKKNQIVADMDNLLDSSEDSTSIAVIKRQEIESVLFEQESKVTEINDIKTAKLNQMVTQKENIESAYERIYAKIFQDIESINIDVDEKSRIFNSVSIYKNRIKTNIEEIGYDSNYTSLDTLTLPNDRVTDVLQSAVKLKIDDSKVFRTIPIVVSSSVEQNDYIKICSFKTLDANFRNSKLENNDLGVFLAEIIISGNNYAIKALVTTSAISRKSYGIQCVAEYAISHDLPFSFKFFKNDVTNEIVVAFKYDITTSGYTSVVTLDFNINLLLGTDLVQSAGISEIFDTTEYTYIGEIYANETPVFGPIISRDLYSSSVLGPHSDEILNYVNIPSMKLQNAVFCKKDLKEFIVFVGHYKIITYNQINRYYNTDVFNDIINKTGLNLFDTITYGFTNHVAFDGEYAYIVTSKGYIFKYELFSGNEDIIYIGNSTNHGVTSLQSTTKVEVIDDLFLLYGDDGKIGTYNVINGTWGHASLNEGIPSNTRLSSNNIIANASFNGGNRKVLVIGGKGGILEIYDYLVNSWASFSDGSQHEYSNIADLTFNSDGTILFVTTIDGYCSSYNFDTTTWNSHGDLSGFCTTDSYLNTNNITNSQNIFTIEENGVEWVYVLVNGNIFSRFNTNTGNWDYDSSNERNPNNIFGNFDSIRMINDINQKYIIYWNNSGMIEKTYYLRTYDLLFGGWQDSIDISKRVVSNTIAGGELRLYNIEITPTELEYVNLLDINGDKELYIDDTVSINFYDKQEYYKNYMTKLVASFTTTRRHHTSVVLDGKIYLIGGYNGSTYLNDMQIYDPNTNSWTTGTSLNFGRVYHSSVVLDGKIYLMGGFGNGTFLNDMQIYDPNTNSWTTGASFTTARYCHTTVVLNGKIYLMGGFNGTFLNDMQIYDPNTNSWTIGASFTTVRYSHSSVVLDGKIYLMGGYSSSTLLNDMQIYDLNTDKWIIGKSFKTARYSHTSVALNGKIYLMGGNNGTTELNDVQIYDPKTNKWTTDKWIDVLLFDIGRSGHTSVVLDGKIYLMGGFGNNDYLNDMQIYEPYETYLDIFSTNLYNEQEYYENYAIWRVNFNASFNIGRIGHTINVLNGKIYLMGGRNNTTNLNDMQIYDPNTNSWTTGASLTTARRFHTSVVLDGKIYLMGGFGNGTYLNDIQIYDPNTNSWITGTSFNTSRNEHTSVALNGKIYLMGGWNGTLLKDIQIYDPNTNSWATGASLNFGRTSHTSVVLDGKIYLMGGVGSAGKLNDMEIYDPNTNSWATGASFTTARRDHTSVALGGKIYLMGGYGSTYLNDMQIYDPNTNSWTTGASLNFSRRYLSSIVLDGKIYITGGRDNSSIYFNDMEIYEPYETYLERVTPNPKNTQGKLLWDSFEASGMPFNRPIKTQGMVVFNGYPIPISSITITEGIGGTDYGDVILSFDPFFDINALESSISSISSVYPGIVFRKTNSKIFREAILSNSTYEYGLYYDNTSDALGGDTVYDALIYKDRYLIVSGMWTAHVATYDLKEKVWNKYNDPIKTNMPTINGSINLGVTTTDRARLLLWTNSQTKEDTLLVYTVTGGKMISFNFFNNIWVDSTIEDNNTLIATSGWFYGNAVLWKDTFIISGLNGRVGSFDLLNVVKYPYNGVNGIRSTGIFENGSHAIQSTVYKDILIVGSTTGQISSCDLNTNTWTLYNNGSGLCDDGSNTNNIWIYDMKIYDNKLFVFGKELGNIYVMDLETNTWITEQYVGLNIINQKIEKRLDPHPRYYATACVVDDRIYLFNGTLYNGGVDNTKDWCEVYNPKKGYWEDITQPSYPRYGAAIVVVDKEIYIIGGSTGSNATNNVQKYNTITDTWTVLTDMNKSRNGCVAHHNNGKIYVYGGYNGTTSQTNNETEVYDISLNSWTINDSLYPFMYEKRNWARYFEYNDEFYITGGMDEGGTNLRYDTIEIYNFDKQSITLLDLWKLPGKRNGSWIHRKNNYIYFGGGYDGTTETKKDNTVYRYDINKLVKWEYKSDLLTATTKFARTIFYDNKMYLFGGWNGSAPLDLVQIYDISTDTWSYGEPIPFSPTRYQFTCVEYDGKVYLMGGYHYDTVTFTYFKDTKIYDISTNTWSDGVACPEYITNDSYLYNDKLYNIHSPDGTGLIQNRILIYDFIGETWTVGASYSSPTSWSGYTLFHNEKIYVAGGWTGSANSAQLREYDIITNSWLSRTDMLEGRNKFVFFAFRHNIYVVGGYGSTIRETVQIYNIDTNSWEYGTSLPVALHSAAFVIDKINETAYIFQGTNSNGDQFSAYKYELSTDTWSIFQRWNGKNRDTYLSIYNNKIYCYGGIIGGVMKPILQTFDYMHEIDTTWDIVAPTEFGMFATADTIEIDNEMWLLTGSISSSLTTSDDDVVNYIQIYNFDKNYWRYWGAKPVPVIKGIDRSQIVIYKDKIFLGPSFNNNKLLIYDINNDIWEEKNLYPELTNRVVHGFIEYDGYIYLIGGWQTDFISSCAKYDIENDTWYKISNLPVALGDITMSVESYNNKIYVFGGSTGSAINTIYIYDIIRNLWETSSVTLPVVGKDYAVKILNGSAYILYGSAGAGFIRYNISTKTIQTLATPPKQFYRCSLFLINDYLYVNGGNDSTNRNKIDYKYDFHKNIWSTVDDEFPSHMYDGSSGVNKDVLYLIGGENESQLTNTHSSMIQRYKVSQNRVKSYIIKNNLIYAFLSNGSFIQYDFNENIWKNIFGEIITDITNYDQINPITPYNYKDAPVKSLNLFDNILNFGTNAVQIGTIIKETLLNKYSFVLSNGNILPEINISPIEEQKTEHTLQYINLTLFIGKELSRHNPVI